MRGSTPALRLCTYTLPASLLHAKPSTVLLKTESADDCRDLREALADNADTPMHVHVTWGQVHVTWGQFKGPHVALFATLEMSQLLALRLALH
jgi:hypothetical protein